MYLDYSNIAFDSYGRAEAPDILLQTMSGTTIGILSNVFDLKLNIKYSEPSEMTFSVGAYSDGMRTPFYDDIAGFKIIYTKQYGIYLVLEPEVTGDGLEEVKNVTAYSIEKELEYKKFFIEEGTYNFWNPITPTDTLLGRILEIANGWSVGYISPTLVGRYRTFDDYNDYLLSFIYNTAPEKFRCVFVFDTYLKTINAYDVDAELSPIPIYLDFDTIMQQLDVTELSNELVTAIQPYGADDLDIRGVNPTGTNWIYDLSYFIANGDIPEALATKWNQWQSGYLGIQEYYRGLICLRSSATAKLLTEQAALKDLEGELESINIQQNVTVQTMASETTEAGKRYQEQVLASLKTQATAKEREIAASKSRIASIQSELDDEDSGYNAAIKSVINRFSLSNYFNSNELAILKKFFIEQTIEEETFVASDVDASISGATHTYSACTIRISNSEITYYHFDDDYSRLLYAINGGNFSVEGNPSMSGDVIRGTLEVFDSGESILSLYTGQTNVGGNYSPSGLLTMRTENISVSGDFGDVVEGEVVTEQATRLTISVSNADFYITTNVSEYQKYSVEMELFDYAVDILKEKATPTYEFSVDSANFIFTQELEPFRNSLELGRPLYLRLHNGEIIKPILIEFEVDFEDRSIIKLVFSNRFKRQDNVNTLKDMIEKSYSSSHSFDTSKYIYGKSVEQASMASRFMNNSLDAAVNTILGARNQSVVINGAGVQIGGDSNYQLRIVDSMIAMSDDGWQTAKLAIGHFYSSEIGDYFGVNADIIGGKLLVGNNLVIESTTEQGVTKQFRFDSTGAWINNGTMTLQMDDGGKILIDPRYGIYAGTEDLYTTDGTSVEPGFIDEYGDIIYDNDGFPQDTNFYLDLRDGSAYFRGTIRANSGEIGGWTINNDSLSSGTGTTHVELNSSGSQNSPYAFWAGANSPANAPFWVKRNGDFKASQGTFTGVVNATSGTFSGDITGATGTFSGVVQASDFLDPSGNSMMTNGKFDGDYLELYGITVKNPTTQAVVMTIGQNGVNINQGSISWNNVTDTSGVTQSISNAQSTANSASTAAGNAQSTANTANSTANSALSAAEDAADDVYDLARGVYTSAGTTFINSKTIYSPTIFSNQFDVFPATRTGSGSTSNGGLNLYGYFNNRQYHMLSITYAGYDTPYVEFESPVGAYCRFDFGQFELTSGTSLTGTWDFSDATVTGITARFG